MKRSIILVAVAALLVPSSSSASTDTTYATPFQNGPASTGSSQLSQVRREPTTGEMTVVMASVTGQSTSLGCTAEGPFGAFAVTHTGTDISKVSVTYRDAAVAPYSFMTVRARVGNGFHASRAIRGPIAGEGTIVLDFLAPEINAGTYTGTMTIWFGIEASSSCPSVDGGRAVFSSVTFTEA